MDEQNRSTGIIVPVNEAIEARVATICELGREIGADTAISDPRVLDGALVADVMFLTGAETPPSHQGWTIYRRSGTKERLR